MLGFNYFLFLFLLMKLQQKYLEAISTIGSLYSDFYDLLEKSKIKPSALHDLMFDKGFKKGLALKQSNKEKALQTASKSLLVLHDFYNIKSKLISLESNKALIEISSCSFSQNKNWQSKYCVSLDGYEEGLVKGINSHLVHYCPRRRSLGHPKCVVIIEWKNKVK